MASKVTVEGIPELIKQFPQVVDDIAEAANAASLSAMKPALDAARATNKFADRGRANASKGNKAHPPGFLRSNIQLFFIVNPKKGKRRVWVSLGVPHGAGAAYYMPLDLGHKPKAEPRPFLEEAFNRAKAGAAAKITAAINTVLAYYGK